MTPSWRKPAGTLIILTLIVMWCVGIVSASAIIGAWSWWLQLPFYLIAGTVWILPLKPLLLWMETGRWRRG